MVLYTEDAYAFNQVDVADNPFLPDVMVRLGGMSTFCCLLFIVGKLYRQSSTTSLNGAVAVIARTANGTT